MGNELFSGKSSLYIGIDESNHGGEGFEIPVAVFSKPLSEEILFKKFSKSNREKFSRLLPELVLGEYHYTFTAVPKDYFGKTGKKSNGIILSSLIKQDIPKDLEQLKIFFDGKSTYSKIKRMENLISDICEIESSKLEIVCKSKFDKKCLLVNRADRFAYFIFKKFDMNYACFHPNYRGLIRN